MNNVTYFLSVIYSVSILLRLICQTSTGYKCHGLVFMCKVLWISALIVHPNVHVTSFLFYLFLHLFPRLGKFNASMSSLGNKLLALEVKIGN